MIVKNSEVYRKHDEFYVNTDPSSPPKQSFVEIANLIETYKKKSNKNILIADIGCAAGKFVDYMMSRFQSDKIVGFEYLEILINVGRKIFPNIDLRYGSLLDRNSIEGSFDVLTISGVLSIFDDLDPIIENLIHWTKPGGKIIIHGMFNDYDVDVLVRYRLSEESQIHDWESGWNIISKKTFVRILNEKGVNQIYFHPFNIEIDLEKKLADPLRSWTEMQQDGKRVIVNGLCLRQPQYIVEINV